MTATPVIRARETAGTVAIVLATAAVYFAAASLGLRLAFVVEQVTTVWPASGLALAAVVLLGPMRACPGIAVGAFLANVIRHEPVGTALGIAAGNTAEALAGAWLLRRAGFEPSLSRLWDALGLVVLAAGVSTMVSATIGVASLCLGGVQPWTAAPTLWGTWWVGDALGDLVAAPVVLVWARAQRALSPAARPGEAALLLAGTLAVALAVFAGDPVPALAGYPLHYTVFPFVIWAALRFGQRGTATVTAAIAAVAIWSTVHGAGPFTMPTVGQSLLMLQLFMAVVACAGLLLGAAITERDVARQQAAADYARLRIGEERLRLALDAGRMGVWDWDIATGNVEWTEHLEPMHGLPRGSFNGTIDGFQALVHPDDRERVNGAIQSALEGRKGYEVEFRTIRPDGKVAWIAASGRAIHDDAGRATRMLGVGLDVTERRRLADELEAHARELADADRRKDEFLAMLAHELRNPLAPLSAALHLIATESGDRTRFLAMAERQVKQLVRLVDDLLDVSRITHGKVTLRPEPVVFEDVVQRAVEQVQPLIEARRHALTISLPPEPVRLEADPARLAQVLANLLGNAVKYTPPGGSIWLTADRTDRELVIRVRDTGAGLDPALLPHVFDVFVQGDASLDRARGGLGIGLTIVRRLVELHGGRVAASSLGIGKGSEFVVHLPLPPVSAARAPKARGAGVSAPRAALRVLVVDDNQDAADALAEILRVWGHEVELAYDGGAALDAAARWRPDVVVSDLGLPGMDGYALAQRIRSGPAFGRALLVALSGYGREEDRQRALEAGFDHHLVKPPDLHALAALLGRVAAGPGERPTRTVH